MSTMLHVLIVSNERPLLRQGALMLEEFAIQVTACVDPQAAQTLLATEPVDVLLLDEALLAGDPQRIGLWKAASGERHVHLLVLCGAKPTVDIQEAFQFGADDFLSKPLKVGEMLARLRAAARYCEFERRFTQQSWEDPVTGLWARQAILDRLNTELVADRPRKLSLVLLQIDGYQGIERQHGQTAAHPTLRSVAAATERVAVAGQCVAHLGDGRFAVLLPDHSLEKATKYAEKLRSAVVETKIEIPGRNRLTVSIGVAHSHQDKDTTESFLARAEEALADAQRSGCDCVATHGQYEEDRRRWAQQMSSGNPFGSSNARDVMTPFSLDLSSTDTLAYAETIFAQTGLEVLPVVDLQGRLTGVIDRERIAEAAKTSNRLAQPIESLVARGVAKIADTTPFEKVLEQFVTDDQPLLVVTTKDGHACGFIDRERFLDLVKPLETSTLASREYSSRTDYLVIQELIECV